MCAYLDLNIMPTINGVNFLKHNFMYKLVYYVIIS